MKGAACRFTTYRHARTKRVGVMESVSHLGRCHVMSYRCGCFFVDMAGTHRYEALWCYHEFYTLPSLLGVRERWPLAVRCPLVIVYLLPLCSESLTAAVWHGCTRDMKRLEPHWANKWPLAPHPVTERRAWWTLPGSRFWCSVAAWEYQPQSWKRPECCRFGLSARLWTPRPSRRFTKSAMEQSAVASLAPLPLSSTRRGFHQRASRSYAFDLMSCFSSRVQLRCLRCITSFMSSLVVTCPHNIPSIWRVPKNTKNERTAQRTVVAVKSNRNLWRSQWTSCRDKEQGSDGEEPTWGDEQQHQADTDDQRLWIQRWRASKPRSRRDEVEWIETNIEIGAQFEVNQKEQEKSETQSRERNEQGEDRNQERFAEDMLHSENRLHEGKAQRQVYVEAHHEEVQDCTDVIETEKLEIYTCQVAQGLYSWEAQHEPRGAHEEQHCRSRHETSEWIENAVARKKTWTANPGWCERWRLRSFGQRFQPSRGVSILSFNSWLHQPQRVGAMPWCHPGHQGASVGRGQYPRYTDARKGRPWVAQKHHKTRTLTRRRNKFVEHLQVGWLGWAVGWVGLCWVVGCCVLGLGGWLCRVVGWLGGWVVFFFFFVCLRF